ncbi:MAG: cation:proton antiporter [Dehalococcoidia bacterium]
METAAVTALGVIGFAAALSGMVARRLRLPAVLIYLVIGAIAGPSLLGLTDPHEIGPIYEVSVEVLVALIVFEGAFSIDVTYLQRVGRVVRNLLTLGMVITIVLATALAGALDVLPWRTALLFGALVSVTGPTVILPLVRREHLTDRVSAVLLAEGILIDPLGAIAAVVILDFVLPGVETEPVAYVVSRLAGGLALGLVGMLVVRGVLWIHRTPTATDVTPLLLGISVATYAAAERLIPGSGLTAMATLGVALAATPVPHAEAVRGFEDDLSRILIAAVFILATAAVELDTVRILWPWGFLTVIGLMVIVRPLAVWVCAIGSDLTARERLYIGLIGPRGVVAASLAAFAGERLPDDLGGATLTALVFLTVLLTVAIQSTYAGLMAGLLEVRAMRALVAGAGSVGSRLATNLSARGFDVVLADSDPEVVERARAEGLNVTAGDVTDTRFLEKLGAAEARIVVGATDSDQANLLFSQYVLSVAPEAEAYARVSQVLAEDAFKRAGVRVISETDAVTEAMLESLGAPVLYDAFAPGAGGRMSIEVAVGSGLSGRLVRDLRLPPQALLLLVLRGEREIVPNGTTRLERGDRLILFGRTQAVEEARSVLVSVE